MNLDNNSLKIINVILALGIAVTYLYKTQHLKEMVVETPPVVLQEPLEEPKLKSEPVIPAIPTTYAEALAKAKHEKKELFLFFTKDSCGWCRKMKAETLNQTPVIKALEKYVFYEIDAEKEHKIAEKFHVNYLPHYMVVNHEENIVKEELGFKNTKTFLEWLGQ